MRYENLYVKRSEGIKRENMRLILINVVVDWLGDMVIINDQ